MKNKLTSLSFFLLTFALSLSVADIYAQDSLAIYRLDDRNLIITAGSSIIADPSAYRGAAMFRPAAAPNNTFWYGPYKRFQGGDYMTQFRMKVSSKLSDSFFLTVIVISASGGRNYGELSLKPSMFRNSNEWQLITIPVNLPDNINDYELRGSSFVNGVTDVYLDYITLVPTDARGFYSDEFTVTNKGNLGIGTNKPTALLDVYNASHANSIFRVSGTLEAPGNYSALLLGAGGIKGRGKGGVLYEPYGTSYGLGKLHIAVNGSAGEDEAALADSRLTILSNGSVWIGTTVPAEKLAVNGKIRAQEIKVETANWPDYVFKADYKIPTLTEVKTFINQNHYLKDLPSAAEVDKDGLSLGEINKQLTKK